MIYHQDMSERQKKTLERTIRKGLFTDQSVLKEIAMNQEENVLLREEAIKAIQDEDFFYMLALNPYDFTGAYTALSRLKDPELLFRLLESDDSYVRFFAISNHVLQIELPKEWLEKLILTDSEECVREAAISRVKEENFLIKLYQQEMKEEKEEKEEKLRLLMIRKSNRAFKELFKLAASEDPSPIVRMAALARYDDEESYIYAAKNDPDPKVWTQCIERLCLFHRHQTEKLSRWMADIILTRPEIEAVTTISEACDEHVISRIMELLGDQRPEAMKILKEKWIFWTGLKMKYEWEASLERQKRKDRSGDFPAGYPYMDEFEYIDSQYD